jgi:anti-sigma factor RsiW
MAAEPDSAESMSAYLDQELDARERDAFESMLAENPQTQAELEDLRKVLRLVSELPPVEAPPDFYDKLSRKLRRRQLWTAESPLFTLVSLPFQVLSTLVILAVAALYMMAQLESQPQSIERDPSASGRAIGPADDTAGGAQPVEP